MDIDERSLCGGGTTGTVIPVVGEELALSKRQMQSGGARMHTYGTETPMMEAAVPGNRVPGIQTGGHDADGSPDTRGITEKVTDAVTGDWTDDKTGEPTR